MVPHLATKFGLKPSVRGSFGGTWGGHLGVDFGAPGPQKNTFEAEKPILFLWGSWGVLCSLIGRHSKQKNNEAHDANIR